jgi:hypothetical protein
LSEAPFLFADPLGQVVATAAIGLVQVVSNQAREFGCDHETALCGPIPNPSHPIRLGKNTELRFHHGAHKACILGCKWEFGFFYFEWKSCSDPENMLMDGR